MASMNGIRPLSYAMMMAISWKDDDERGQEDGLCSLASERHPAELSKLLLGDLGPLFRSFRTLPQ